MFLSEELSKRFETGPSQVMRSEVTRLEHCHYRLASPTFSGREDAISRHQLKRECCKAMPVLHHDKPLGGKLEGLILPPFTTRTNFKVFNPAHSPPHLSSFDLASSSLSSGTHRPPRYSRISVSFLCTMVSSALPGGRPGLRCKLISANSSSCRAINLCDFSCSQI